MSVDLTSEQLAAVMADERRVLCEAGAGSGKTGVLIERALRALCDERCEPSEILAFTFTNKAAEELRERLRSGLLERAAEAGGEERQRLVGLARDTDSTWFSTIHSFCRRVLAANPVAAGVDPGFRTIEDSEGFRLRAEAVSLAANRVCRDDPDRAADVLAVNQLETLQSLAISAYLQLRSFGIAEPRLPEDPPGPPDKRPSEGQREAYRLLCELVVAFGEEYRRLKDARSGLDFDDLQLYAIELLEGDRGIADGYREQFSRILVDEFQDSGPLEIALIEALEGPDTKIFMVGDELQSIYGFRRADLRIFRRERAAHLDPADDDRAVKPLRGNFRSHAEILGLVNHLGAALLADDYEPLTVGGASGQLEDDGLPRVELLLTKSDPGWNAELERPDSVGQADITREAEAELLAARLAKVREERPDDQIVVLVRAATQLDPLRAAFERFGLDAHFASGKGYWDAQEVGDIIAILRLLANPTDDEALLAVLASPACGVTPDTLWLLARDENGEARHAYRALELVGSEDEDDSLEAISTEDREALLRTKAALADARRASRNRGLTETIEEATSLLGYDLATLMRERGSERWANVRKLIRAAGEFEAREGADLRAFVDYCELERDAGQEGEAPIASEVDAGVTVMTIHAAKGLQFDVVAVAQLGQDLSERSTGASLRLATPDQDDGSDGDGGIRVGLKLKAADLGNPKQEELFELSALKKEAGRRSLSEDMRLFHVATTRAKRHLILSGGYTPKIAARGDAGRTPPSPKAGIADRLVEALELTEPEASGSATETIGPAEAVEDLDATPPGARLQVTWSLPEGGALEAAPASAGSQDGSEAEQGDSKELREARQAVAQLASGPGSHAPAVGIAPSRLSFTRISTYERCPYKFFAERDLRLGTRAQAVVSSLPGPEAEAGPDRPQPPEDHGEIVDPDDEQATTDSRAQRYGPGNSVHRLLEWSARHDWRSPPDAVTDRILALEGLPAAGTSADRIRGLVAAWLESELLERIRRGSADGAIHPELPFVLGLDEATINGSMDLVVASPSGAITLVDYKANALRGADPADLMESYVTQRDIYALALAEIAAGSPISVHYAFLEKPTEPVSLEYDEARLQLARERVGAIIESIGAEDFPVTEHPYRGICGDCPARRLCPHSEESKDREKPEPAVAVPEPAEARDAA